MVKNESLTMKKESYRQAVLEVIEFSSEDIVTASSAELEPSGKGENITDNYDDFYWWN